MSLCECCKKEIPIKFNKNYCKNCSLYTAEMRKRIGNLTFQLGELKKEKYGTPDGRQRIRC